MSLKNDQPILMKEPMVRMIMSGRKTQTRRLGGPTGRKEHGLLRDVNEKLIDHVRSIRNDPAPGPWIFYGEDGSPIASVTESWRPGMVMWIKEVWTLVETESGVQKDLIWYRADDCLYRRENGELKSEGPISKTFNLHKIARPRWKPKLFMPHWAARIRLEITAVRIERLQQITVEDAIAEGVDPEVWEYESVNVGVHRFFRATSYLGLPREIACYAALWDSIHTGKIFDGQPQPKPMPWSANPYVFVITFKRIV